MKKVFLIIILTLFTIRGQQFTQQGPKLVGTGVVGATEQGYSVGLSADGNTAVVGGPIDNGGTGATWIYTRVGTTWSQQGLKLVGTGAVGSTQQGTGVAISADGNTIVVGGPADNSGAGAVWVFTRVGNTWSQQGSKLVGTGAAGNAQQGTGVALSGDGYTILVGGFRDSNNVGAAWVFTRVGNTWSQQGSKLVGTGAIGNANQAYAVALSSDGNTALLGGYNDNNSAGAAWVFTRVGATWSQQGSKLVGSGAIGVAVQGNAVALSSDGNTALVGGYFDNTGVGAAWVFTRVGATWSQQGSKLSGTDAVGNANQGFSVALSGDGNTAILGGYLDNAGAGASWAFTRIGNTWSQQGSKFVGIGAIGNARQGNTIAISSDGNTVLAAGWRDNNQAGAVWVFIQTPTSVAPTSHEVPDGFQLMQNYPNPFNPATTISFSIPSFAFTTLKIYDVLGKEVTTLVNEEKSAGNYEVNFSATSGASQLSSGIYFYRIQSGSFAETKKMIILK